MGECPEKTDPSEILDVRGLFCPVPIIRARRRLDALGSGSVLEVLADDPITLEDLPAFCRSHGHEYLGSREHAEGFWRLRVRKR
jgi:tRNA 2-thiouridine synthesizing protein A